METPQPRGRLTAATVNATPGRYPPFEARGPRRPIHALFFAALPPDDIKTRMATAWRQFGTGAPFRDDRLHLSIYAVAVAAHLDPVLVARTRQAAGVLRTAPFRLCFDRLVTFNGRHHSKALVLVAEGASSDLNAVAGELHAACRTTGRTASRSTKITPHVTLAYGPGFEGTRPLDTPILWTIDDITLIDSHQGRGRHVHLGKWPLPKDRQQPAFEF